MTPSLPSKVTEAMRLLREGKVGEATTMLSGDRGPGVSKRLGLPSLKQWRDHLPQGVSGVARQASAEAIPPEGAAFLKRSYANRAGSRDYRLYVPSEAAAKPLPLLVMLHGCTQDAVDFANGTRMNQLAEASPMIVAYPEQAASANPQRCWNWFEPAHQQAGQGEPSLIAGITEQIIADHPIDRTRVFIAGLSAGGAAALATACLYPDLFAAVGVHSGLPVGAAHDLASALSAMRQGGRPRPLPKRRRDLRTIVFHGSQDGTVHPRNAEQILAQVRGDASSGEVETERGAVPNGRDYTRAIYFGADGRPRHERWIIQGAGHAWSGGSPAGSYTDPAGPDASLAMVRFFLGHSNLRPSSRTIEQPAPSFGH